jgi:hypothetical protein
VKTYATDMSTIYGVEHLLRLIGSWNYPLTKTVKLPQLITIELDDDKSLQTLEETLNMLLQ